MHQRGNFLSCLTSGLKNKIIVQDQYKELQKLIIEKMVQRAMKKEMKRRNTDHRQGGENTHKDTHPDDHHRPGNATTSHVDVAFEGLYDTESEFE